jgi:hypothetical protein
MRQFDPNYARYLYNIFDVYKILRVYFGKEKLKVEDKRFLKHSLVLFAIYWLYGLIWVGIFIGYYDVILN